MTSVSKKKRTVGTAVFLCLLAANLTYFALGLTKTGHNLENTIYSCVLLSIAYVVYLHRVDTESEIIKGAVSTAMFFAIPVFSVFSIWNYSPAGGHLFLFLQNCFLLLVLQGVLFLIIFRMTPVLILATGINWFLFLVDEIVLVLRKTPLVPADVTAFKTAMAVSGNYKFEITSNMITATCALILVIVCVICLPMEENIVGKHAGRMLKAGMRIGTLLFTCFLMIYISSWEREDYNADNFDVENMNVNNGTVLTFYLNYKEMIVEQPDGYDKDSVKAELAAYNDETNSAALDKSKLPNVIIIMDEAFSDLGIMGDLDTNKDPLEFCHRLVRQKNVVSGHLNVSVWGGSTCNTEFEVMTGNTLEMLPYGSIPYMQYVSENTDSLCSYFHKLGYTDIAIHPYWGQCWRRDTVYGEFGFNKFIDAEDFDPQASTKNISGIKIHEGVDFGKNLDYVRNYISDDESFSQIENQFEKKKEGEKLFVFNVTMQNHGGYLYHGDNYNQTVECGRVSDSRVNQYLSLVDKTDDALKHLIEYFNKVDEPTVILFYGDHQPGLGNNFYEEMFGHSYTQFTNNDFRLRYTVPYYIWANYKLKDVKYDEVSANYLSMVLKDAAGLPFDSWDTFRSKVFEKYPVMTARMIVDQYNVLSVRGALHSDLLDQYNRIQYYKLFQYDKK